MSFGNRLKLLRLERNLTQEELGQRIGKKKQTIHNYEHGSRKCDHQGLIELAEAFNVSVDYLLGRTLKPIGASADAADDSITMIPYFQGLSFHTAPAELKSIAQYPMLRSTLSQFDCFLYNAPDDAMSGSRILTNDLLLVRTDPHPPSDSIVLAATEDSILVRMLRRMNNQYYLIPNNPQYNPDVVDAPMLRIFGIVERVSFTLD